MGANAIAPPPGFRLDSLEPDHPPLPEGFELDAPKKLSPQQQSQESSKAELRRKAGVGEAVLNTGTGALAGIASGYAGLLGAALPGPEGQGANWQQATQQALTYQPRLEEGRQAAEKINYPFQKWMEAGHSVGESIADISNPALGAAGAAAFNFIPAAVSRGARPLVNSSMTKVKDVGSMKQPINETLARGQELGFKTLPEGPLGKVAQKAGGTDVIKAQMKRSNQEVVDSAAREYAGLGPKDPLFRENLELARDAIEAPYGEIARISPTAASALQEMKTARRKYQLNMEHYRAGGRNPDVLEKADAFKAEEKVWTDVIEQEAQKAGKPDLLARFKDARVRSAQNHTVEDALIEGSGSVNARKIAALDRKTNGKLLTGKMKAVADWANTFPDTIGDARMHNVGGTHMEAAEVGAAIFTGHAPAAAGIIGGRMLGRGVALSKFAQPKDFGGTPSLGLKLRDIGTRPVATGAAALTPSLGLQPPREEY